MAGAAIEVKGSVDFNQKELRNARFQRLLVPPVSPVVGQIYQNSINDIPYYWDSVEWNPFGIRPVHKRYNDEAEMLADQTFQIYNYIYYRTDEDIYYEYLGTTTGVFEDDYNPIGGRGVISGTPNYLTKYNSPDGIIESQIFDNGTKIGIGSIDFITDSSASVVISGRVAQLGLSYGTTYFGDRAGFSDNLSSNFNTGFGTRALEATIGDTLGYQNSSFGAFSLMLNTTGHNNNAFGFYSLHSNTTGNHNAAFGNSSLFLNTIGVFNSAFGHTSLGNNTTGNYNTGLGMQAGILNTTGSYNTYVGARAMEENQTGSYNVFMGYFSGNFAPAGTNSNNSIAIGALAALSGPNQTNQVVIGYNTTGWGSNSVTIGNTGITRNRMWGTLTHAPAVLPEESVILSQLNDAIGGLPVITASNGLTKVGNDIRLGDVNLTWLVGTGLTYGGDWEVNFGPRSLVTAQWVTSEIIANAYVHPVYTALNPTLTGALVLDSITTDTIGSVTGITTRTLTPTDIGAASSTQINILEGQVAFGTGNNVIGGDSGLVWNNTTKRLNINSTNLDAELTLAGQFRMRASNSVFNNGYVLWRHNASPSLDAGLIIESVKNNISNVRIDLSIDSILFRTNSLGSTNQVRWEINNSGVLQAFGTQTIQTSSGDLTIKVATIGGNINLIPFGDGSVLVGPTTSPTNTLDVNGTTRIRSISNLGITSTEVLVPDALGVLSKRTLTEFKDDLGIDLSLYVPYTGATQDVNLGNHNLTLDSVIFNDLPSNGILPRELKWNTEDETLDLGMNSSVTQQIGLETYYHVKNQTGSTIVDGTLVMATGTLGASGRILVAPAVADGSVTSKFILGITTQEILNGGDGFVTWFGTIRKIDTTGSAVSETWADGDVLWANPSIAGGLTNVEPLAPNLKVSVAIVLSAATNGTIFVRPSLGMRLTDLHDVNAFTPTTNNLIAYNGNKWENKSISDLGIATTSQLHNPVTLGTSNGLSLSGQELSLGVASSGVTGALSGADWNTFNGKIGGSIAAGQVAFGTGVNTIGGDAGLFWDNTNKRLGVGVTPTKTLDIQGSNTSGFDVIKFKSQYSQTGYLSTDNSRVFISTGPNVTGGLITISNAGLIGINNGSPTNTLDVNGTTRIRSVANATGNFLTTSATGVIQQRTAGEVATDIGAVTITGTQTIIGEKTFNANLNIGNTALDYVSWDNTSKTFGIFSQVQYIHKYRGGAAGALNMGQFNVGGDASINNTSNAKLLFGTNNTTRLEIEADGDVLLKKVDNGVGNFLTIDASTGQIKNRTASEAASDLGIGVEITDLTSVTITDEGGGATYSTSGSPNNFWLVEYGGRKFIQIEMSNINTSGTPTGNILISFSGATINQNFIGAYVESITGSNITNIEKRIPVAGVSSSSIRLALKDNRSSFASGVTFTSGSIRLIIPAS